MSKFFDLHDQVEKKYLFNSFLVFVGLVEVLIFFATLIWQLDEGWFGGEVKVIPFPWKEYLIMAFLAPVVMIFLFGLIVRGFDLLSYNPGAEGSGRQRFWRRLNHRRAVVSYILGLLFLFAFGYSLLYPAAVIPYLRALFRAVGLWGLYIFIGLLALAFLYLPISLWLRYRLAKKAMEYHYLMTLAEKHGLVVDQASGRILPGPQADLPAAQDPSAQDVPQALPSRRTEGPNPLLPE